MIVKKIQIICVQKIKKNPLDHSQMTSCFSKKKEDKPVTVIHFSCSKFSKLQITDNILKFLNHMTLFIISSLVKTLKSIHRIFLHLPHSTACSIVLGIIIFARTFVDLKNERKTLQNSHSKRFSVIFIGIWRKEINGREIYSWTCRPIKTSPSTPFFLYYINLK